MRESVIAMLEKSIEVKNLLQASSFELHHYEDGDYVDFHISKVNDPRQLTGILDNFDYRLFAADGEITIRIFENF